LALIQFYVPRRDMKKSIAVAIVTVLVAGIAPAQAATQITVSPQNKVSKKNPVVTLTLKNLPVDHGIYVSQCMAPKVKGEAPTACNPSPKSKAWISTVEADIAQGAKPGNKKVVLKLDKYFDKGDCVHTKCVLFFTNDHNASSDRSEDQAIPFKFDGLLPF
jgi:hypothetical protein